MKALIPDGSHNVRLCDVPDPQPAATSFVLAVEAFSVNRGETFQLEAPRQGWRPGKDVSGTVLHPSLDGASPKAGTRVVAHLAAAGWAEQAMVGPAQFAELPEDLDTGTAAALPLAGLTAVRLVRRAGPLLGRRLLITGASGGVGHYVTELATAAGAEVTAVVGSPVRGERLRALGAHTVTELPEPRSAHGYDVTMESVGGNTFAAARRLTRPDGLILWFGQASRSPVSIDFFDWVDDDAGAPIEQFSYAHPSRPGDTDGSDLATLVALVAAGRLHPEIGSEHSWLHTHRTITDLRERRVRGNAVLTIDPATRSH